MGSLLSRVTSTAQALPSRVFLYAREKWGKSSLFAHAPGAIFFMTRGETGLTELIAGGRVPPTAHFPYDEQEPPTWATLRQAVRELREEDHQYRFLVIDTCNGAEMLCQEHVRNAKPFNGSVHAFNAYGKGMEACRVQWFGFLQDLDSLRSARKMTIVLLAHTQVKKFDDPTAEDSYDKYRPACADKLWDLTNKWSDIICFGHFEARTYETDSGKVKAKNEVTRVLCFDQSPLWEAGNRYGIAGKLDVSSGAKRAFDAFAKLVSSAKAASRQLPPPPAAAPASPPPPAPVQQQAEEPEPIGPEGDDRPDPTPAAASTASAPSTSASATPAAPSAATTPPPAAATTKSPSSPGGDGWPAEWSDLERSWADNALQAIRDALLASDVSEIIRSMPARDKFLPAIAAKFGCAPTSHGLFAATRPARTMPAAERRTGPAAPTQGTSGRPANFGGERLVPEIVSLLGKPTGLDWTQVRDDKLDAEGKPSEAGGVAKHCGFRPSPDLKLAQLLPSSLLRLAEVLRAVAGRRANAAARRAEKKAGAAQ
jgi:hypothetical protein